jgi:hypothetical protein
MEVTGWLYARFSLPPGIKSLVSIVQDAAWAPEPVLTRTKILFTLFVFNRSLAKADITA